jgi:hypothetical protein
MMSGLCDEVAEEESLRASAAIDAIYFMDRECTVGV